MFYEKKGKTYALGIYPDISFPLTTHIFRGNIWDNFRGLRKQRTLLRSGR